MRTKKSRDKPGLNKVTSSCRMLGTCGECSNIHPNYDCGDTIRLELRSDGKPGSLSDLNKGQWMTKEMGRIVEILWKPTIDII